MSVLCDTQEPRVGDTVVLVNRQSLEAYNAYDNGIHEAGSRFRVTRVYAARMIVRNDDRGMSYQVWRRDFEFDDPNRPVPRKLGQKPEGDEFIDVNDPRIQWIWDDLGTYADRQNWCPQYDNLCREVGVPGRPQDFHVTKTLNGVQIRATIKARSQGEANDLFALAMASQNSETE